MILRFSEEFTRYTNGLPELRVEGETVGECLNKALTIYPQLYVYLMDGKAEVAQKSAFRLNGEYIFEYEDCQRAVTCLDTLELSMDTPAGGQGAIKYIPGALMMIVGAILWWTGGGTMLFWSGVMSVISAGISDLMAPAMPSPDSGGGLNSSSAYTFNGIRNTTAAGTSLQVVYGKFRVGGHYLNIYTESASTMEPHFDMSEPSPLQLVQVDYNWLYAQIGLCEGKIHSISDFRINKLPTNFYNAIEFVDDDGVVKPDNFRLGTADQTPMPKFNKTSNTTSVSRKIIVPDIAPTPPTAGMEYTIEPVWGFYDDINNKIAYGYFDSTSHAEVDKNYPDKSVLHWEDRDRSKDGSATMPLQFQLGDKTWRRNYLGATQTTTEFNANTYTRIQTQGKVNGFTLTLTLPGLYAVNKVLGYLYTPVSVAILYRDVDSSGPWTIYTLNETIVAKQRAEILKSYTIPATGTLPLAQYEIAVIRNTPDHTGWFEIVDDIYIKELTEYQDGQLAYPHTAMLGAVIRATDQISGQLPTITSLVEGLEVALPVKADGTPITDYLEDTSLWSGEMSWDEEHQTGSKYFSDNPVWCMYDLLTNKRYGLADYYKIDPNKLPIMRAMFFTQAQYCNQIISYTDENGDPATRKRFALNMVIDQSKSASEWLSAIAGAMRATCFYTEGIFWVDIDRPKFISHIFNMSNIKDYTQQGTSFRNIPNCYEVQFPNPELDYEIDSFRVESQALLQDQHIEERKKALTFMGVTNFDQAKALTKYTLLTGEYLTKMVTFKTGTDGLRCMISDVIGIQHDVPQTGWGGKIAEVGARVVTGGINSYTLELSTPFDYREGMGALQILIESNGETPETLTVSPPTPATEITTIVVETSSDYVPRVGAHYILSLVTNGICTYKVLSVKRDADEMCEITAVQYDESIFDLADNTADLGEYRPKDQSMLTNPQRISVQGLVAEAKVYQDSAGVLKTGIEVVWQIPQSSFWTGAVVNWGLAGTANFQSLPVTTAGHALIPDITVEGTYQVVVTSVYKTGQQSINDALSDRLYYPFALVTVTPYAQNDGFLEGISGLEVIGSLDGTYTGKECKLRWRAPVALDQFTKSDTTTAAAGNATSSWLSYYQVEIRNVDGSIRRVAKVSTEAYSYTHEMNHEDGKPARTYDVVVIACDRLGRSSKPVSLRVINPSPAAIPPEDAPEDGETP